MKELISKLLSGTSQEQIHSDPNSQVFMISPAQHDSSLRVLHPAGYPKDAPPIYSVTKISHQTPNMVLSRGLPGPSNAVAFANIHMSKPSDLIVHGQHISMKMSQLSGNFTFWFPPAGEMKWKVNKLTGSSFELFDSAGTKLAKYGSAGLASLGDKKLQLFVPCDAFLLELIILSAIIAKDLTNVMAEVAGEVGGAVGGAVAG